MAQKQSLYLASPLGFSESGRVALKGIVQRIEASGWKVLDPWDLNRDFPKRVEEGSSLDGSKAESFFRDLVRLVGQRNEEAILAADLVVSVLDGADVDSGVASEIGFARARGKTVIGYRGDFRLAGDCPMRNVNLQIEHFIESSGGCIVRSLDELVTLLDELATSGAEAQPFVS